jgi:hypothetical protein
VNSVAINGTALYFNVSIYGDVSQFLTFTKAPLNMTQDFETKIILPGTYKVAVETYEEGGVVKVLLGGSCGDNICTSVENSEICDADCADACLDGVCNFPGTSPNEEGCFANFCSDCIGSQADCDVGEVCEEDSNNPGTGVCVQGVYCGDGTCSPYVEDCENCNSNNDDGTNECINENTETCCFNAITGGYYTVPMSQGCGIPPSVTSCADWCKYIADREGFDYNSGVCAQIYSKCDTFGDPDGLWVQIDEGDPGNDGDTNDHTDCDGAPDHPDADNECDGDEYCFAGAQSNTCCCIEVV